MPKPRVTRQDDPELDIDYVTGKIKDLAAPSERICTFTLRAGRLCSHYLLILPVEAHQMVGAQLRQYVLEHVNAAAHTRTCEKVK